MFSISVLGRTKRSIQDGRSSKAPDARHGFMVRGRDLPDEFARFGRELRREIAQFLTNKNITPCKVGPLLVINGVITPVTHL